MSSIDWAALAGVIETQAIRFLGGTATLYRQTAKGALNPATGQVSGRTEQSWEIAIVLGGRREFWQAGAVIRAWSQSASIAAGTVEPQTGDIILVGGRRFVVGDVNTTRPDGVNTLLYEVELKD